MPMIRFAKFSAIAAALCGLAFLVYSVFTAFKTNEWSSEESTFVYTKAQTSSSLNSAPQFPSLTGRVVDNANLLQPSNKALLEQKLKSYEEKSSDQIVVATIKSLNGENLEEYSNLLFRHWKLGQAEENNGVLLLIAHQDRKLRIEVGYGLEAHLTDAAAKNIIDLVIVPNFKSGKFIQGINDGVDWIVKVLEGDAAELEARAKRNKINRNKKDIDWPFVIFMTIWVTLFFGPFLFVFLASTFGKKLGKNHYEWLGFESKPARKRGYDKHGNWHSGGGGWSSGGGGGFSGGGGSSGGGGASGGW